MKISVEDLFLYYNSLKNKIDYFEDPFPFSEKWQELSLQGIPLALDENVNQFIDRDLSYLKAIILKPNIIGSFHQCFRLMDLYPHQIVLSSSLETKIGLRSIEWLANSKKLPSSSYHGLDTLKFLAPH